jgi:hypothetical protein
VACCELAKQKPDSMDETMGELDAAASNPMLWHKGRDFVKGKDASGKDVKVGCWGW